MELLRCLLTHTQWGTPLAASQNNNLHLWFAFPDDIRDETLLSEYARMMSAGERARHQRFHFEKDRHQFLVSRALVRTMLSRYTRIRPADLRFSKNQYGRPEIMADGNLPPVRFNLSHTDGLVVCAVVRKDDIGVDVEDMNRKGATVKIANRFFSPREVRDLNKLPEPGRRARFFDYWTLKEAYIKARGMGLSIPLDQFSFHVSENDRILVSFDPRLNDSPAQWRFWTFRPTDRHKSALAVCQGQTAARSLSIKKAVPLLYEQSFDCPITRCSHPPP